MLTTMGFIQFMEICTEVTDDMYTVRNYTRFIVLMNSSLNLTGISAHKISNNLQCKLKCVQDIPLSI